MKIIISPAKKINIDNDFLQHATCPIFLQEAETIYQTMQSMNPAQLQALWKCNDKIARQNIERLQTMNLNKRLTPAILAYEGIQYQYMAPHLLEETEMLYLSNHLVILSGLYGMLRPLDGVIPYRLEMQAKLQVKNHNNLYSFWGDAIADELFHENNTVINLASKEYSKVISPYIPSHGHFITCSFKQQVDNKLVEKGTFCKMARGQMVRWLAKNNINNSNDIKLFNELKYKYSEEYSTNEEYVFIMNK